MQFTSSICFCTKIMFQESMVGGDDREAIFDDLQPGSTYKIEVSGRWEEVTSPMGEAVGETGNFKDEL